VTVLTSNPQTLSTEIDQPSLAKKAYNLASKHPFPALFPASPWVRNNPLPFQPELDLVLRCLMSRFPGSLALVLSRALPGHTMVTTTRIAMLCGLGCIAAFGSPAVAQTPTTTTLTITSGGSAVTTVSMGTVVTLTATVTAGATPVSPGQVNFCDATAAHCEDIHIVGTAQLTGAGTAVVKFRPGVGSHSYNAVFLGTPNTSTPRAGSASSNVALTVTAPALYPSVTQMSVAGSTGNYQLGATVSGIGSAPPTGTVSFLDTSNGNAQLGTASLSNASSSFGLANVSNPATGPGPIAVADFNLDGIPDMFVPNTVLLGNGDGTFTAAASSLPGSGGGPAVVGDFNGDGIPDLALGSLSGQVTIELGKGDGTFTAGESTQSLGFFTIGIVAGDFNGDGNLDLAVLSPYAGVIAHAFQITILLGHGDGTFTLGPTALLNDGALGYLKYTSIAVGDFNGDGKLDIVTASEPSEDCLPETGQTSCNVGSLTILLGNGDGTFNQSTIAVRAAAYLNSVVVADLNGDGIPDLAVTDFDLSSNQFVDLLQGNGDGTFTPQNPINQGANQPYYLAVGDFNGDGIADLALTYSHIGLPSQPNGLMLYLGKGDGTFNFPPYQFPPPGVESSCCATGGLVVGDFNGDGLQDLAAPGSVLLSQTQFATTPQTAIALSGVGTHLVEASYPGDTNYAASTSATATLNLSAGTPTVTLTLSANPTNYGTPETSTTVVSGADPTPTGTVTVYYNGQGGPQNPESEHCVATLDSNGTASCTTLAGLLGGGTYSVFASYSGDTNYPTTNSSPVSLAVINQSTPIITWPTPSSITYGTTLSATQLNATSPVAGSFIYTPQPGTVLGAGTHTLSVTFNPTDTTDYASATATVSLTVSQATPTITWSTPAAIAYGTALSATQLNASASVPGNFVYAPAPGTAPAVGSQTLSVAFTPTDTTDYTTATATTTLTVNKATPTIALATSAASAFVLNPVIFTATVTSAAGTPTGSVTFSDGTTVLGTATMASGMATYTTSALLAGTHSITAVYSGDTNFATLSSSALSQVIENFTIGSSGGTSSVTANPGGQAVYTFTVTPPTGTTFAGPISFSVTGLPTGATAAFSPATVPAGAGTTSVIMTVTLPASASVRPAEKPFPGGALPIALGLILLPFAGRLRRTARGLKRTVCLLAIELALAAGLTSCGGSGGGGGSSPPPQNYVLTVTASAGSLSNTFGVGLVVE
jgi:hypothetical protein